MLIKNTIIKTSQGLNGGVFFVHYNSVLEMDNCTFYNSTGIINGIGTIENNGRVTISNSRFLMIYALKTSLFGITDSP